MQCGFFCALENSSAHAQASCCQDTEAYHMLRAIPYTLSNVVACAASPADPGCVMRMQSCDDYVQDSQDESGFADGDINIYDIYADVCFAGRATDEARQFLKVCAPSPSRGSSCLHRPVTMAWYLSSGNQDTPLTMPKHSPLPHVHGRASSPCVMRCTQVLSGGSSTADAGAESGSASAKASFANAESLAATVAAPSVSLPTPGVYCFLCTPSPPSQPPCSMCLATMWCNPSMHAG